MGNLSFDYTRNVRRQYLVTLFQSLIPAYVIERLFWQARGVDVQGVVWCEIIYGFTVIVLEIPSGVLADRFGRKRMLLICGIFNIAEFVILLFARSFWVFGLAVFLAGVGRALSSGSRNALLYDSLLAIGKQADFEKLLGRLSAIDLGGTVAAALSGGALANLLGFEFNYVVSACAMGLAFLVILTLREPPMVTKPEGELTGGLQYAKQALTRLRAEPLLLLYCFTGALLGACMTYPDEFWQLAAESAGIPVVLFGAVGAGVFVSRIPGNLLAYKLKEKFSCGAILTALVLINAAGYIAFFSTRSALCLIPLAVMNLAAGVTEPLIAGYLHHRTESSLRATTESFMSLALRFISMPVGLVFGYVSARHGVFTGFLPLGAVCLAWFVLFICAKHRHGRTATRALR